MTKIKGNRNISFSKVMLFVLMIIGALMMLMPFWWMVLSAFKTPSELLRMPPTWFPERFSLDNFRAVLDVMPFWKYLFNSVFVGVINTVVGVFTSALVGYVFAKYKFPGQKWIFMVMLGTLIIPYELLMLPLFTLMLKFGWIDSYYVLTIPYFFNVFGIFLMRQFMLEVPDELIDAARIDGCSHFRIFLSIVLPVVKPAMATLSIFLFMVSWDSYLWPLISINSQEYMTLPIGLATFITERLGRFDYLMAASVLNVLPILIVFLFAQKKFIEGIALSGTKG